MGTENTLSEEDMNKLSETLMNQMNQRFDEIKTSIQVESTTQAPGTTAVPVDSSDKKEVTLESMKEMLTTFMEENKLSEASKVYETMLAERITSTKDALPGFEDYLDGEDDYGKKRSESLTAMGDYDSQISTLNRWAENYKQAANTSNSGNTPVADVRTRKKLDKAEANYDEVDKKWMSGEFKTVNDFTESFFDAMSKELDLAM